MIRKNYDSDFCGSLPLHQINSIQPYGYLLVLDRKTFEIVQASENVKAILGLPVQDVINKKIDQFIKGEEAEILKQKFQNTITDKIPLTFTINEGLVPVVYTALAQAKESLLIIELQPTPDNNSFIDVYQNVKYVMAQINIATSIGDASQVIVNALRQIAGFDRVLMYQFDENWNGTVIAEDKAQEMEPYIGLKFPASDIPKQARDLYLRNTYRLIPERDYAPVKLYPVINPLSNSFIDLSDCNLRSVAAVHLEYMKNMGIQTSMSIRVIKDDKLWGLISCHHREPKYVSYEACSVFELLSAVISSKISSLLGQESLQRQTWLHEMRRSIIDKIYSTQSWTKLLNQGNVLLDLFAAGGIAVTYKGNVETFGQVPSIEAIKDLVYWLQNKSNETILSENSLALAYEDAQEYAAVASGLLAIPVNAEKGQFIILFRPEVVQNVEWGGNPDEAINFEPDGKKYHPRNSFKVWKQTLKNTSLPWLADELNIAEGLRSFIFEYSSRHLGAF